MGKLQGRTIMHFKDGSTLTDREVWPHQLTEEQFELIAAFPEPFYVGYRGVVDGTYTGPGGRTKLSRLTADQFAELRIRLRTGLRVGG